MDLQFCQDSYAVLSYITDYYSKDESGITERLKAALKESKSENLSVRQTMHVLKRSYMAKRQIGLCEAIYRACPKLCLKKTNVRCIFVASGFPKNITHVLKKVCDTEDQENEADSSEEHDDDDAKVIQLDDRNGNYIQSVSILDKYKGRNAKAKIE